MRTVPERGMGPRQIDAPVDFEFKISSIRDFNFHKRAMQYQLDFQCQYQFQLFFFAHFHFVTNFHNFPAFPFPPKATLSKSPIRATWIIPQSIKHISALSVPPAPRYPDCSDHKMCALKIPELDGTDSISVNLNHTAERNHIFIYFHVVS